MPQPTLPPEILHHIFSIFPTDDAQGHVNDCTPLFCCTAVSRDWRSVALPMVWNQLHLLCNTDPTHLDALKRFFRLMDSGAALKNGFDYAGYIRKITISVTGFRRDLNIAMVMPTFVRIFGLLAPGQLNTLEVHIPERYPAAFSQILAALVPLMTSLKSFYLEDSHGSLHDADNLVRHLPLSLEELDLTGEHSYDDDDDMFVFAQMPDPLAQPPLLAQPPPPAPTPAVAPKPPDHTHIFTLPNLRHVTLKNQTSLPAASLAHGLQTWGARLTCLSLIFCDKLYTDAVLRALASHCPRLTSLTLVIPDRTSVTHQLITDRALADLLDACHSLESINFCNVHAVSDRFLARCAAGPAARALRSIDIQHAGPQLTGSSVVDVSGWAKLEELSVSYRWMEGWEGGTRKEMDARFVRAVRDGCKAMKLCWLGMERVVGPRKMREYWFGEDSCVDGEESDDESLSNWSDGDWWSCELEGDASDEEEEGDGDGDAVAYYG
ncbi:hypothetical protein BC938DRAFT_481672 [Jimgerdemannia flammicorona]|uniref:F-box domain-containing protein n=1 Tax=Jimgerdemannia flammicorona TaxID=994334 RepID=A0A433QFQ5_9FUNG|nr:hypothetical protein BC938DRAFT_481672 [Jimgerdemannia flammicorona]